MSLNRNKIFGNSSLIIFVILSGLPMIAGCLYAFSYSLGFSGVLNNGFTLEYWKEILTGSEFWTSLLLSFGIAILVLFLASTIAIFIVGSLQNEINKSKWNFAFQIPTALPPLIMGFYGMLLLGNKGLIARILNYLGITSELILVNDNYNFGVIAMNTLLIIPAFILLYIHYYQSENITELRSLSHSLGASNKQFNLKVLVPLLLKKSSPSLTLYGLFIAGSYEIPLLLGSQQPRMLSVLIAQKLRKFDLETIPEAYAISAIYAILVITIVFILNPGRKFRIS